MVSAQRKSGRELRRHFLREWRDYRHLTQEQAADRVGLDRTTLGRIENRKIAYTQPILEALAEAYMCEPWDLLNRDPFKEGEVIDLTSILRDVAPELRAEIIGYARGRIGSRS